MDRPEELEAQVKWLEAQVAALRMAVAFLIIKMDAVGQGSNADSLVVKLLGQQQQAQSKDPRLSFALEDLIDMIDTLREP